MQRQTQTGVEASKLRQMRQGVAALKQELESMRAHAMSEQAFRVAEGTAVRKSLRDLATQHAEQAAA